MNIPKPNLLTAGSQITGALSKRQFNCNVVEFAGFIEIIQHFVSPGRLAQWENVQCCKFS